MAGRMLRAALAAIAFIVCTAPISAHAQSDGQLPEATTPARLPKVAHRGHAYLVRYEPRTGDTVLLRGRDKMVLESASTDADPVLVGADTVIGLLPEPLQVYRDKDVLVYVSAIRTMGGGGQCGSGSEIFLKFLDVAAAKPAVKSSVLVGSCEKAIELDDQNLSQGVLGAVAAAGERLSLRFLYHGRREGNLTALVSKDLRALEFQGGFQRAAYKTKARNKGDIKGRATSKDKGKVKTKGKAKGTPAPQRRPGRPSSRRSAR